MIHDALVPRPSIRLTEDRDDSRWQAVLERDARADGAFVYAVSTTRVFCRPSCGARTPLRKNVSFYRTPPDAKLAGFRACKRCEPESAGPRQRQRELVVEACRRIERAEREPTLHELARAVGVSPFHFSRVFKRIVGVTPKQYAIAHRSEIAAKNLKTSKDVTTAIYDSGYGASSRFYESNKGRHGMTATKLRKGGQGVERTVGYLDGESELFELPLDVRGTAFQELVWRNLRDIPSGQTASYGEIAARIGRPKAARAVAGACAANPVAVIVPCHRVVRADGDPTDYRWGIQRKRQLLNRESTK